MSRQPAANSGTFIVRTAVPADHAAIVTLVQRLSDQHVLLDPGRFHPPEDITATYAEWIREGQGSGRLETFVVEGPADIMAYAVVEDMPVEPLYWSRRHAYVHDIYVSEEARGANVGSMLVEACRAWARQRGIGQIRGLIATQNHGARAFFRRCGWRDAAVEMIEDLAPSNTSPSHEEHP